MIHGNSGKKKPLDIKKKLLSIKKKLLSIKNTGYKKNTEIQFKLNTKI